MSEHRLKRDENGELMLSSYQRFRRDIRQALIDSKKNLFGYYEDSDGNLYMNCNGGEFSKY